MGLAPSAHRSPAQLTMLASNVPFDILFGIFVLAMLTLVVIVITWAIRRDRAGRAAWLQRQQGKATGTAADRDVPPTLGE
jgi:hypothetical protein